LAILTNDERDGTAPWCVRFDPSGFEILEKDEVQARVRWEDVIEVFAFKRDAGAAFQRARHARPQRRPLVRLAAGGRRKADLFRR